jgi:hypothetical protein
MILASVLRRFSVSVAVVDMVPPGSLSD